MLLLSSNLDKLIDEFDVGIKCQYNCKLKNIQEMAKFEINHLCQF